MSSMREIRVRDVPLRGPFDSNPSAHKLGVIAKVGSRMIMAFTECSTVCAGCARTSARKEPRKDIFRTCRLQSVFTAEGILKYENRRGALYSCERGVYVAAVCAAMHVVRGLVGYNNSQEFR
jgi:hypothetical protein